MGTLGSIVSHDIKETGEMLHNYNPYSRFSTYDKVYFETNEACDKLISKFNVRDKNILTVLGSGDQAFQFYKNGAKSVDLFDINKLTIYYYYLRIWHIKKYKTLYPEWGFDINYLKELLLSVKPNSKDEMMAYKYWSRFISKFDSKMLQRLFHSPYNHGTYKDVDTSLLIKKFEEDNFHFFNKDISKLFDVDKKYDFIYTSNLSDYIKDERIKIYRDNLYKCLNNGGIVLSSNLSGSLYCDKYIYQRKAMKKYFKFKGISAWNEDLYERDAIGYSYKKRKIKRII